MITLLTDFGNADAYVGIMKGVIASHCPTTPLIDLTHNVPPQDLEAARFHLLNAFPYFPRGTIHLVVVDPGVGTQRRPVALKLAGGYLVGPDNGVLSGVCDRYPVLQAVTLDQPTYWRTPNPSPTFHGRDIFAPVAGYLATGIPLGVLGTAISPESLVQLPIPPVKTNPLGLEGCIQAIDHFGNGITTFTAEHLGDRPWQLQLGATSIPQASSYSSVSLHTPLALVGSHGWVEIAVNQGNAQAQLGFSHRDRVTLTWR
jgi:hypothetical protein